ncbi:hypothetical protein SAMN04515618_12050 [Collimonas sp. OK307]|nr:hypothetical protein [Collimonas sp. OK307]SFI38091.1 hypothetical protein SAMN04515618_12050 [Collimonas sp. OK307]
MNKIKGNALLSGTRRVFGLLASDFADSAHKVIIESSKYSI